MYQPTNKLNLLKLSLGLLLLSLLLTSCLKFGDNLNLKGKQITEKEVTLVERQSKLVLPENIASQNFYYFGDTIDPYWYYKAKLDAEAFQSVLQSDEFAAYSELPLSSSSLANSKVSEWFKPEELRNSLVKEKTVPGSSSTVHIGEIEDGYYIYITYHSY